MGVVAAVSEAPTLVVAEAFGTTVQGEGPSLGRRASFLRLMGCNLACSWCDSGFTWDASRFDLRVQGTRMPVPVILERLAVGSPGLVVITGGEPLLHQHQAGWRALLDGLCDAGIHVEVETNGTLLPTPETVARVSSFNVSPKLGHGGDPVEARLVPEALARFSALADLGMAGFKFVATGPADVAEIAGVCDTYGIHRGQVWVMPEGTTAAAITTGLGALADAAVAAGFNLTTRLHVLAWGDERGR